MLLFFILAITLVAALAYLWQRGRLRAELAQLLHALRAHPLIAGLLLVYGLLCGILLVVGFPSPLELLLFGLPLLAGACAGWWELRRDAARPSVERAFSQGMLAGLLAALPPALVLVLGSAWQAWLAGELLAEPGWLEALGWAGFMPGVGAALGLIGALAAVGAAGLGRGRPRTPAA